MIDNYDQAILEYSSSLLWIRLSVSPTFSLFHFSLFCLSNFLLFDSELLLVSPFL